MTSMPRVLLAATVLLATALPAAGPADSPRQLTFEQRVAAQRAIERVYYSHQQGATRPFEQAVPREVLEQKVRTYLKQSVALDRFWRTPVTAEALRRELERIASKTQFPDRLREIYTALGNDPVLIQECLARPVLVERLAQSFFAYDERIHGEARARAEQLRQRLVDGRSRIDTALPRGRVLELVRATDAELGPTEPVSGVPSPHFERTLARLGGVGDVGQVQEERGAFTISTLLAQDADRAQVERHAVRKANWKKWWQASEGSFPEQSASTVALAGPLPSPSGPAMGATSPTALGGASPLGIETCAPEDGWDYGLRYDVPGVRYGHEAIWTGSLVLLWGGGQVLWDEQSWRRWDTGARYDPATDTWASMSAVGAPTGGMAVWAGREMVVLRADGLSARYNPISDTWKSVSDRGAPWSFDAAAVWTGKEVIVWGGRVLSCVGVSCSYVSTNTGARYDPAADVWTPTTTVGAPSARSGHAAVWTGKEMVVWGGHQSGGRYDPETDTWRPIAIDGAPPAVNWARGLWIGQEMFVWGPSPECFGIATMGRYDPVADMWSRVSRDGAPAFGDCAEPEAGVWTGREVIIFAEGSAAGRRRYHPALDSWKPVSNPAGVIGSGSPVWTSSRMVVWGGTRGAMYDPIADAWEPMSGGRAVPGILRNLSSQSAVWTGSLLIAFGSYDDLSDDWGGGASYDPLTDSWVAGPSWGLADPRVAWTGDFVIVWGGGDKGPDDNLDSGAKYDPITKQGSPIHLPGYEESSGPIAAGSVVLFGAAGEFLKYDPRTDTWDAVSAVGAPVDPTRSVWTGSEVIFWSRSSESSPGGSRSYRLNPATGSWAAVSTLNAPALLSGSAVWADHEMIVWGSGLDGASEGGRYDPATDSWAPMSQAGAPSLRFHHSAIWTGKEMVVWGGRAGLASSPPGPRLNTGGRYDPRADTWLPTTTRNAPPPIDSHRAFWADPAMLIWGRRGELHPAGGRYYPSIRPDLDADGFSACEGDCNDDEASANPAGIDLPGNFLDENCDGTAMCDPRAATNKGQLVSCIQRECGALVRAGAADRSICSQLVEDAKVGVCGNGIIEGIELCDGADLGGRTCEGRGFESGTLACSGSCDGFDSSACVGCGNELRDFPEPCDGGDLGDLSCQDFGFGDGALRCDELCGFDVSECIAP